MSLQLAPYAANNGFFYEVHPYPVLMVPLGGTNYVQLRSTGSLKGANADPADDSVATANVIGEMTSKYPVIAVRGRKHANTLVTVSVGAQKVKFVAAVRRKLTRKVDFVFVTDAQGHKPSTPVADTKKQIARLDRLYIPQANIDFSLHTTRRLKMDVAFGKRLTAAQQKAMWAAMRKVAHVGNESRLHWTVFVVKKFDAADSHAFDAWGMNPFGVNLGVLDDGAMASPTPVMAHECGHSFGLHHVKTPGLILKQGNDKGDRLYWYQVHWAREFLNGLH